MAYEIVNQFPDGTYHLRDNVTGEDMPADEGTLQSLNSAGQLSMGSPAPKPVPAPVAAPMGPPAPPPQPGSNNPFIPTLGTIGSSVGGALRKVVERPFTGPTPPGAAPAGPAAPAAPANRIAVRPAPQGTAQRDPNAGLIVTRTPATKAAWVPTSKSEQGVGEAAEDKLQAKAQSLYESQLETARIGEEAKREDLLLQQARANDERIIKERRAQEMQMVVDAKQQHEDNKRAELQARRDKVRSMQVDPDLVWKEKGVAGSILSALAMGAGQFASGMTGQENLAAKLINNMVERSVDAQKSNIAKAGAEYSEDNDEFNRNIVGGAEAARLEQKQLRLEAAEAQARQVAADREMSYLHPTALQTADALAQQSLEIDAKLEQLNQQASSERFQPAMAASTRITVDPLQKARKEAAETQRAIDGGANDPKQAVRDMSGNVIGYSHKADEINDAARNTQNLNETLGQMRELADAAGVGPVGPDNAAKYRNLAARAKAAINKAAGLGTLDSGTAPLLEAQIPSELGMFRNNRSMVTTIDTTIDSLTSGVNNYYRQQGLNPPAGPKALRSE